MIEQGLVSKWKKRYWPKNIECQLPNKAEAIRLDDLQGVFYLLFAITGIAFCVFLLEIIFRIIFTKMTE